MECPGHPDEGIQQALEYESVAQEWENFDLERVDFGTTSINRIVWEYHESGFNHPGNLCRIKREVDRE